MNIHRLKGKSRNPLVGITNKNAGENNSTPDSSQNVKKLFTPCRRIGLNRNKNFKGLTLVLNESSTSTSHGSLNDVSDVRHTSSEINIANETRVIPKNSRQPSDKSKASKQNKQEAIELDKKFAQETSVQLEDVVKIGKISKRKLNKVYEPGSGDESKSNDQLKRMKKQKYIPDSLNAVGSIENDLLLINQTTQVNNMFMNEKIQVEPIVHKSAGSNERSSPKKIQRSIAPQAHNQESSQLSQSQKSSQQSQSLKSSSQQSQSLKSSSQQSQSQKLSVQQSESLKSSSQQSQSQKSSQQSQSQKSSVQLSQSQKSSVQLSQSQEFPDIVQTPRSSQLLSEDEYNSDRPDFSQSANRRKKKKSISSKHKKHSSKASTSKSKQDVNETRSVVSTTYDSDSDDDFVVKPRREKRSSISSKKDSSSQSSIKNEMGNTDDKKKLKKLKKVPAVDELNRTEHIRIAENKSYTIVHKGNVISYVKSHDNDVDMKTTESDDNQQPPLNYDVPTTQKSMIIERKDYTMVDSTSAAPESVKNSPGCITSMFDDIINSTAKNKQLLSGDAKNRKTKKSKHTNESSVPQRIQSVKQVPSAKLHDTHPPENVKQSQITVKSVKSLSSDFKERPSSNEPADKTDVLKVKKEVAAMEATLKVKQDKLARLQRVSVYKRTHDLQALRTVTLRMKRGCQEALIDLLLVLKEHSNEEFDMGTLLHNMKIPNELVGYNEEDDNFV